MAMVRRTKLVERKVSLIWMVNGSPISGASSNNALMNCELRVPEIVTSPPCNMPRCKVMGRSPSGSRASTTTPNWRNAASKSPLGRLPSDVVC